METSYRFEIAEPTENDEKIAPHTQTNRRKMTSAFKRNLLAFTNVALVLVIFAIGVTCWIHKQTNERTNEYRGYEMNQVNQSAVCFKPECIEAVIPDDQKTVSVINPMQREMLLRLKSILEEEMKEDHDKYMNLTRIYYQSCMDKQTIEEKGLEPLTSALKNLGGWPLLLDEWNESSFDWKESVYRNRRMGHATDYFLSIRLDPHPLNASHFIISVGPPRQSEILQSRFSSPNTEKVDPHLEYMIQIANLLGGNGDEITKSLNETFSFERSLYNISAPDAEMQSNSSDVQYNLKTIRELSENHGSIPWLEFFNTLLAPGAIVTEDDAVNVDHPNIKKFEELLEKTPKRVQANYAMWRVVYDSMDYLNSEIRNKKLIALLKGSFPVSQNDRWAECVKEVTRSLSPAVGALYSKKSSNRKTKDMVTEMFYNLLKEMKKMIENATWMDEKTRETALNKAAMMETYIAYPDEFEDEAKMEEIFKNLELSPDTYLQNKLNCTRFQTENLYKLLKKSVAESEWLRLGFLSNLNAHYSPATNRMIIPAGILLGLMFNVNRPQYMNYASVGYAIGHEITHGFDTRGNQFGPQGGVVDWWDDDTKAKFKQRVQCIINQYSNYTDEFFGAHLKGAITQDENIADNGGIKVAYRAYEEWAKKNGPELLVPGLNYTQRQMFWISSASFYCVKKDPFQKLLELLGAPHSPSEFRVIGPLSNMPEFARDFDCPKGSPMNPEQRCSVW